MAGRSGKIQLLFILAFFALLFFVTIAVGGIWRLVQHGMRAMELNHLFRAVLVLYFLLALDLIAGLTIAMMSDNRFYSRFFGLLSTLTFASVLLAKSIWG